MDVAGHSQGGIPNGSQKDTTNLGGTLFRFVGIEDPIPGIPEWLCRPMVEAWGSNRLLRTSAGRAGENLLPLRILGAAPRSPLRDPVPDDSRGAIRRPSERRPDDDGSEAAKQPAGDLADRYREQFLRVLETPDEGFEDAPTHLHLLHWMPEERPPAINRRGECSDPEADRTGRRPSRPGALSAAGEGIPDEVPGGLAGHTLLPE